MNKKASYFIQAKLKARVVCGLCCKQIADTDNKFNQQMLMLLAATQNS